MRRKLAYIACLPHSGSTLLNLLLGQHPEMIGLGGIDQVVRWMERAPDEVAAQLCSCGEPVGRCPYWSEVLAAVRASPPRTLVERYELALLVFERVFGPAAWPLDASQIRQPLGALAGQPNLDLRVLFLARDFRSAVISIVDLKRRRKSLRRPCFFLAMEAAFRWRRENARIAAALRQTGLPRLPIGYEELCLSLNPTFARICAFLEVAAFQPTRDVHAGRNHSFVGNGMRQQSSKARMIYDYRWMTRSDWWLPALLVPGLLQCNRDWVYASGGDQIFSVWQPF
jgi:hypothetical protein